MDYLFPEVSWKDSSSEKNLLDRFLDPPEWVEQVNEYIKNIIPLKEIEAVFDLKKNELLKNLTASLLKEHVLPSTVFDNVEEKSQDLFCHLHCKSVVNWNKIYESLEVTMPDDIQPCGKSIPELRMSIRRTENELIEAYKTNYIYQKIRQQDDQQAYENGSGTPLVKPSNIIESPTVRFHLNQVIDSNVFLLRQQLSTLRSYLHDLLKYQERDYDFHWEYQDFLTDKKEFEKEKENALVKKRERRKQYKKNLKERRRDEKYSIN